MDIIELHTDLLKVRFRRAKSNFIKHDDCIEIIASNGDRCFIDLEDADLAEYSWYSTNGYFNRNTSRSHPTSPSKIVYLHVLILERVIGRQVTEGEYSDHIDWNKENNRRQNIRVASKSENAINSNGHKERASKYKGVTRAVDTCRVQLNYSVTISETGFTSELDAAKRYDELAACHHGKFATFNFPENWIFDFEKQQYQQIRR